MWRQGLLVTMMVTALACGAPAPLRAQEQVFRINNMVEPESLDPGVVTGVPEHRILSNLFEGLTTTDPKDLSPRPGMAASWTVSKDGLTYTFTLRDALWTDGRPVTAQDFVFAWERVLNPKSGAKYAQQLFDLKNGEEYNKGRVTEFAQVGVKALDPKTLQVTLKSPTAYFLDLTSFYTLYPVPRWALDAHGKDWVKPGKIVSNGPFRLSSWVPQKELVLEKNPQHWDAASVKLQKVVFLPTDDINTAYKQFLAGDSDWMPTVPPAQLDAAKSRPEYYVSPYLGTYYFRFNVTKTPVERRPRAQGAEPGRGPRGAHEVRHQGRGGAAHRASFPPACEGTRVRAGSASIPPRRRSCWRRPAIRTARGSRRWSCSTTPASSTG